jgi:FAD binding domain-containing protein
MGPDPASFNAATIGGLLANNAGGMRCPLAIDSYRSIVAMKIVLTTGTIIDTEEPHAEESFAASKPEMAAGLLKIREEILADKGISDRIARKYGIRNTNGYAMHAFLDGETPVEILRRLMVGSEGTSASWPRPSTRLITSPQKRRRHGYHSTPSTRQSSRSKAGRTGSAGSRTDGCFSPDRSFQIDAGHIPPGRWRCVLGLSAAGERQIDKCNHAHTAQQ